MLNAGENMKEQRIIINSFGVDDAMRYVKQVMDQGMLSANGTVTVTPQDSKMM